MTQITLPYSPRPYQAAIHDDRARFRVVVAHRRAGKTVLFVNECIKGLLTCNKVEPRLAYIAPTQRMAKRIAWGYVQRYMAPVPGVQFRSAELAARTR